MLQEVGVLPTLVLLPSFGRIKGAFVLGTAWKKKGSFGVLVRHSSPRRRHVSSPGSLALRLGERRFA